MRRGRAGVWREEGDVQRVILWRVFSWWMIGEVEGRGRRGTCLPIMPMQAIEGVVIVGYWRSWKNKSQAGVTLGGRLGALWL